MPFGIVGLFGSDAVFGTFVRQNGKELFTPDGLGFDVADAQAWFDLMVKFQKAKAIGSPEQISEEASKALAESALVTGKAALQFQNSNQLEAVNDCVRGGDQDAAGPEPDRQGNRPEDLVQGEHAVVGVSQDQEPGGRNCVDRLVCERPGGRQHRQGRAGHPAELRDADCGHPQLSPAQQTVAKFITDIKTEVANTPPAPPPGGGTLGQPNGGIMLRYEIEVLFGRHEHC